MPIVPDNTGQLVTVLRHQDGYGFAIGYPRDQEWHCAVVGVYKTRQEAEKAIEIDRIEQRPLRAACAHLDHMGRIASGV